MRKRNQALLVVALIVATACASVGTGDPVVVRAEDVLSNSLTIYTTAMDYHYRNSTKESPAVYRTFENFRIAFPTAWKALDTAKRAYQKDKSSGRPQLDAALNALTALIAGITPLLPTGGH